MTEIIKGKAFVVTDNIDTDQIIPAQYLNLVPTIPEEYEKLGSYALSGLPEGCPLLVEEGKTKSEYSVIIAGSNFGCGSSREHAPVSLGAAGIKAVAAQSFARIFFRNCIATGELYPVDSGKRICDIVETGDEVELDLNMAELRVPARNLTVSIKPLGDAKKVIEDGGLFEHARKTGMIA